MNILFVLYESSWEILLALQQRSLMILITFTTKLQMYIEYLRDTYLMLVYIHFAEMTNLRRILLLNFKK